MDTIELQHILDKSAILAPLQTLVCPKDHLPKRKPSDVKAYIVNTHDSDQPGEHWVAIFFKENRAIYFDSYGLPPLEDHIQPFLQKNTRCYSINTMRVQSDKTPMCGVYCIFALDMLVRGCDLDMVLNMRFRPEYEQYANNDKAVARWFKQHYGRLYNEARRVPKTLPCQCCAAEKASQEEANYHFQWMALMPEMYSSY